MGDLKGLGPWFVPVVKGQGNSGQGKDNNSIWCPRTGSVQPPGETTKPTTPGSELRKVLAGTVGNIRLQCGLRLHILRAAPHQPPATMTNLCHVPPPPPQHHSPWSSHSQALSSSRTVTSPPHLTRDGRTVAGWGTLPLSPCLAALPSAYCPPSRCCPPRRAFTARHCLLRVMDGLPIEVE